MFRKWIIAIASIGILIFLILRLISNHVDGVRNESQWYIDQLNFKFSATIDSVRSRHILFHLNDNDIDWGKERRLNERLKYNGRLDLFLYRPNNRIELMIMDSKMCMKGDSIHLNSNENVVTVYRDHNLIAKHPLIGSLKGRPF